MTQFQRKSFNSPDEVRTPPRTRAEVVSFEGLTVTRVTYDVGWRWSEHIKPIVGTQSCQVPHLGYIISGRCGVQMDDGTTMEFGPGDLAVIPPGHDGWTIGEDPCVVLDFYGASRANS